MTTAGETAKLLLSDPAESGRTLSSVLDELSGHISGNRPIIETLPCGLALIDDTVGGLIRGEYVGIPAAPGVGKSTLADQLVVGALCRNPGTKAAIFALETATPIRAARLLAASCVQKDAQNALTGCIPIRALLRGEVHESGKARALTGLEELKRTIGPRLKFVDSVTEDAEIARIVIAERPDVVLVDHLGLVTCGSQTTSETARMDESLARLIAAIREANSAAIIINEINKSALMTGQVDLAGSRGSARFASLAALYIGLECVTPAPGQRDRTIVATIHKSRFGESFKAQPAVFFGGLCHFAWGSVGDVEQKPKRGKRVPGKDSRAAKDTGAAESDSESSTGEKA